VNDDFKRAREDLIREIEAEARDTQSWTGRGTISSRILEAIAMVPRHAFVPDGEVGLAYGNFPLPIGFGQTISQPYIVAIMTELLDLDESDRVLEVGTGSGYQAAVLAELVAEVFTVEFVPELAEAAERRLTGLGYRNVHVRAGNGRLGWPEEAPFDAVMITAAADQIPPAVAQQLRVGGHIIVPLAQTAFSQQLVLGIKRRDGHIDSRVVLPVAFVPLRGRDDDERQRLH
jgi:protein-L-isoaspartate(D-aspartate) O-methyltransferase